MSSGREMRLILYKKVVGVDEFITGARNVGMLTITKLISIIVCLHNEFA